MSDGISDGHDYNNGRPLMAGRNAGGVSDADPNTVYLFSPRYKWVPFEDGMREEIDWDATAKASAVILNIGENK